MGRTIFIKSLICLFSVLTVLQVTGYIISWKATKRNFLEAIWPEKTVGQLRFENTLLRKKIESLKPNGLYITIDTAHNILHLNKGKRILLQSIVSCGSGIVLIEPSGRRKWLFETPRGEFVIQSKYEKPTWIKPDWAFIEEGKPIPKKMEERAEERALGDYALGFGNGYFIHGTLYTRLLGKNITHGCIRMGDEDLKRLFETVPIGTTILIF